VPHKIEVSPSGRATCKTCATAIPKGELRFGEAYSSQFADEAFRWHHLNCAAKKLPHQLAEALPTFTGEIPNRAELDATLEEAKKNVKVKTKPKDFPHADKAPTGRAKCIACEQPIEKGAIRVAVEREVDTGAFTTKGAGYLHPACAGGWAEENDAGEDFAAQVLANTSGFSPEETAELTKALGEGASE
jgi:hypothetical protein